MKILGKAEKCCIVFLNGPFPSTLIDWRQSSLQKMKFASTKGNVCIDGGCLGWAFIHSISWRADHSFVTEWPLQRENSIFVNEPMYTLVSKMHIFLKPIIRNIMVPMPDSKMAHSSGRKEEIVMTLDQYWSNHFMSTQITEETLAVNSLLGLGCLHLQGPHVQNMYLSAYNTINTCHTTDYRKTHELIIGYKDHLVSTDRQTLSNKLSLFIMNSAHND